jgi:hypothetical protein
VSGIIKSFSRSPADKRFRPSMLAARVLFCNGFATKLVDSNVRCECGCRVGGAFIPTIVGLDIFNGAGAPFMSSFCRANIRRRV